MVRREVAHYGTPLALWNVFGALDLVVAIALGVMSAPGTPLQVFIDGPGTLAMGQLPWVMVPVVLVALTHARP
jgi:hypothetical protein